LISIGEKKGVVLFHLPPSKEEKEGCLLPLPKEERGGGLSGKRKKACTSPLLKESKKGRTESCHMGGKKRTHNGKEGGIQGRGV